jgi:hypothetical protein
MKTKEEIKQLAKEKCTTLYNGFFGYIEGYKQCQEDNSDKKYTEEDLRKAFNSGVSSGWNAQENKEAINADEYINSLKDE